MKTLSECATYQEWRESVSRWALMCGGAHSRQLILELIDQFQKKKEDTRAKMLLEKIWNDTLKSGIAIHTISLESFLDQLDKKWYCQRPKN